MNLDGEMRQDAEVSRTPSKKGVEQLGVIIPGDFLLVSLVVDYLERRNVVSEQTEAATQLAISTGLDVASKVNIDALSVRYKNMVIPEIFVEFPQSPADARANESFRAHVENFSVVGISESHFQV
jgi:hypothetical protein